MDADRIHAAVALGDMMTALSVFALLCRITLRRTDDDDEKVMYILVSFFASGALFGLLYLMEYLAVFVFTGVS